MDSTGFVVEDLDESVEILVDEWGVPHIYAESTSDVFIAQGFNAARERLFQIDLWRRRGLGRLAEVLGPSYVDRDRAARLFLYRGPMFSEWLAYGSSTKRVVTAFVAGINAFVELCKRRPELLPPEFELLGYQPSSWEPEDIARIRSHGLYHNVEQEVARARTLSEFGPTVENLRRMRDPDTDIVVPEGLDLAAIPTTILDVYRLATAPVDLGEPNAVVRGTAEGSNNWVIAGSRTASGRALLANDPHRAVTLPSLRYLAHLSAPGLDVIGAGEPALPGVSVGHNDRLAFGFTVFAIDQEDLYVYETKPGDATSYRYRADWEAMTVVHEQIGVAGASAVDVELRFTRHGPVICEQPEGNAAYALRAAWLEPGMAPYLGSIDSMTASRAEDFVDALNRWGSPGENHVYADIDGAIGWRPAGLVPVRPNWDGLLPVPGDGRYEWAGYYDMDQLPASHNPDTGWFATANEMNLPVSHPHDRTISHEFYPAYRYQRIAQMLAANYDVTVEDCVRLQTDYVSLPARSLVALLREVSVREAELAATVELLLSWDGDEHEGSAAAAFFEIWYRRHLRPALLSQALHKLVPPEQVVSALAAVLPVEDVGSDPRVDLALLADLKATDFEALRILLTTSLSSALTEARSLLGADVHMWRWGALHRAYLAHPIAAALDSPPSWTTMGPYSRGGSGDTVGAAAYTSNFVESVGATLRVVIDVGEWDKSVAMNSPGQSGDPRSPHYEDLFGDWANDQAFPLLFSRDAVEEHTQQRILLTPSSTDASRDTYNRECRP